MPRQHCSEQRAAAAEQHTTLPRSYLISLSLPSLLPSPSLYLLRAAGDHLRIVEDKDEVGFFVAEHIEGPLAGKQGFVPSNYLAPADSDSIARAGLALQSKAGGAADVDSGAADGAGGASDVGSIMVAE